MSHEDDEELLDVLRARTQAPGEGISTFVTQFRTISEKFRKPLIEKKLVSIAYKNLIPEYRGFVRLYKVERDAVNLPGLGLFKTDGLSN